MTTDLREQLQATLGDLYTLERELGGGGMSRVFVAEEARLGRRVVGKVLAPELTEGMSAERFAREVRLAARLQHPNIVPLLATVERDTSRSVRCRSWRRVTSCALHNSNAEREEGRRQSSTDLRERPDAGKRPWTSVTSQEGTMSRTLLIPLAAVLLAGCASDSTGPTAPTAFTATDLAPRAKVERGEAAIGSFTWDLDRGLLIATGLPAQITESDFCGGALIPEFSSFKENGQRRGVIHFKAWDREASLYVYQLPSDWDFDFKTLVCETLPFAVGTGRTQLTDKQPANTLERVRTISFHVQGDVTVVATGEVLSVTVTDHTQFYPDGSMVSATRILLR